MSTPSELEGLRRLGAGASIESVCQALGMPVDAFHQWWTQIAQRRALATHEQVTAPVGADVRIARDLHGIPHVLAENDWDLFFGFGWAIAEDRLFQLDWLRRKATGRLSEIVGCEGLESDRLVRTIGLSHIATAELAPTRSEACYTRLLQASMTGSIRTKTACRSSSICSIIALNGGARSTA